MTVKVGDRVMVAVEAIQRSDGAAWKGTQGQVIGETGDGYRISFPDGFIADRVKASEITTA